MEVDQLEFEQLIDVLEDLEGRRTPVGWAPEDAVVKTRIERRILDVVMEPRADDAQEVASHVACRMQVVLRTKRRAVPASVLSIGAGGAFVEGADLPIGTHVHLQVKSATEEYGLHVRAQVAWRQSEPTSGVGLSFAGQPSDAHERRVRRFVLELLRHRQG